MNNPLSDALQFLVRPGGTTVVYWLLLLGSIGIALYAWRNIASQRSWCNVADWLCRFFIGSMWWQQTLWKLPPLYTDNPSDPINSGLHYWMMREGQSAALRLQADLVNHIVLPHFSLFAPIVYGLEVLTAVSLILRALLGSDRGTADPESLARLVQRRGRVAVDLLLPARPAGDLRAASLREKPGARCNHPRAHGEPASERRCR
jgi:hypothetical protein